METFSSRVPVMTPLMAASRTADTDAHEVVIALLQTVASLHTLNVQDVKGRTALMFAARCGSDGVLQSLIEAGADLETLCERGESAWFKATQGGHVGSVHLLEAAGARHGNGCCMDPPPSMPTLCGCDAGRFATQYRNRMPVCLRSLVAGWPACSTWNVDRARLVACLGGATCLVPCLRASLNGRSVAAEKRIAEAGSALSVEACLTRVLDVNDLESRATTLDATLIGVSTLCGADDHVHGHADEAAIMCKLSLTAALVADLGEVPHRLFGAPTIAFHGETRFWLSSAGAITPLHFDHCHSVICQVVGRKRVTCFAPRDSSLLYPFAQV